MEQTVKISVCIPTYNSASYIRECIESVIHQSFSDFELIVIDDGSTDDTCSIVESYTDSRIQLIQNKHNYIDTQNKQLHAGKGTYLALLDHDDRMLPDRLKTQYEYMEEHPDIDVLGGGIWMFGHRHGKGVPQIINRRITLHDLLKGNQLYNPTVMIRRSILQNHTFGHEEQFLYASDYGLWMRMIAQGIHIENIPTLLIEYRTTPTQITSAHYQVQFESAEKVRKEITHIIGIQEHTEEPTDLKKLLIPKTKNKLTLIIPFLNEKEEVKNTVASARHFAGDAIDILVINDHSTDGYNYRNDLDPYHVIYIYNEQRLGVAASRDRGVSLCKTPFFLLLDAHMRFYEDKWPERLCTLLEEDERCVLCCQTRYLYKNEYGDVSVSEKAVSSFGAYMPCIKGDYIPDIRWNSVETCPGQSVEAIPAVLGAGYAASKTYWQHLRGLEGLLYYGSDESYISCKVWMEGGRCLLVKDVVIGHIYREDSPFRHFNDAEVFNHLWIAELLFPASWKCLAKATALFRDRKTYASACSLIKEQSALQTELKQHYASIFTKTFKDILPIHRHTAMLPFKEIFKQYDTSLPAIASFLRNQEPPNHGLVTGKMGHVLWFCHYKAFSHESLWDTCISNLWEQVEQAVEQRWISGNFAEGLAGIGWGLFYLYENHFIDNLPTELIEQIDEQLSSYAPNQITDTSFYYGAGGILCYCVQRYKQALLMGQEQPWTPFFFNSLEAGANNILETSNELCSINYAMQYLQLRSDGPDTDDFAIALHDWMSFQEFIPASSHYWVNGLTGNVAASSLPRLLLERTRNDFTPSNSFHHE